MYSSGDSCTDSRTHLTFTVAVLDLQSMHQCGIEIIMREDNPARSAPRASPARKKEGLGTSIDRYEARGKIPSYTSWAHYIIQRKNEY